MKVAEIAISDPQIGTIYFVTSKRAKQLNIRIKTESSVRVAVPVGVSLAFAKSFVKTHRPWIIKHQVLIRSDEIHRGRMLATLPADESVAKNFLSGRLKSFAARYDFKMNRVSFRRQRTRWGSCSRQNNISLNLKIAALPTHLQDYILLHELVHIKVKNHGPRFWHTLNELTDGRARLLSKELKKYRLA